MDVDFENLHHAYLVIGDSGEREAALHELFLRHGEKLIGSPDFFLYNAPLFGIEEARSLSVASARKAFVNRKIFLIVPERITTEAQNALLKTFEDPAPHTHFFLVVREESLILPTLRSRMLIWRSDRQEAVGPLEIEAKKFLKLSVKDRINFAKKFADAEKNISVFLDELLAVLKNSNDGNALKEVYPLRLVSDDRGVSPRLILEHLSLIL